MEALLDTPTPKLFDVRSLEKQERREKAYAVCLARPCLWRPSKWSGSDLRAIRARNGVGRPPVKPVAR